ncbi:MAG: T9SS type A sorting domain-containing protein [Bacteroidetes bacterium]|jgi:hypothetical protein|nr:T9SS type A sorting domain-containing protein [Bacteroidota bacterium]
MKVLRTAVILVLALMSVSVYAQRTASHYILNPTADGTTYSFEVWSQRTNATGSLLVGITSYIFDVNQAGFDFLTPPVLSNVNTKYTGALGVDDYDPMKAEFVNVGGVNKLAITVKFTGNNTGLASALVTTAPNGEQMCTVSLTVANATLTSSLAWDLTNSAMTTSNLAPNTDTFVGSDNSALPVQLTSFTAAADFRAAELRWSTSTEADNHGFEIERREVGGGGAWTKIAFVPGAGTSSSARDYSYRDVNLPPGRYAYQIKQVDNGGSYSYSGSVEIEIGAAAREFALTDAFPNPFNPATTIEFSVPSDGFATLKVFNVLGQEVATLFEGIATAGRFNQARFDATNLPTGLYFSRLEFDGRSMMKKLMLTK